MSKNISKHLKLLVISDTGMYLEGNQWYAFGPVVAELEYFSTVFTQITWIGFNRIDQKGNSSYKAVNSNSIKIKALKRVGGVNLLSKIEILINYPKMWSIINKEVKDHNFTHVRAPSNPAIIAMQLSKKYNDKQFWFKYAGSWIDKASRSYEWQRKQLKSLKDNSVVTVNGSWSNQPKHILAFDNPCLDSNDRISGREIIDNKTIDGSFNICFVGGLNENKGILNFISALELIKDNLYGEVHVVGDGPLKEGLMKTANGKKVNFYGYLSKEDVVSIYKKSHFIVLPSKSEGFPKVISEAMNYGCIPIVSNVSCIPQIITDANGFLLTSLDAVSIANRISKALLIDKVDYNKIAQENYNLADKFTYQVYLERMSKEIFNFENLNIDNIPTF